MPSVTAGTAVACSVTKHTAVDPVVSHDHLLALLLKPLQALAMPWANPPAILSLPLLSASRPTACAHLHKS